MEHPSKLAQFQHSILSLRELSDKLADCCRNWPYESHLSPGVQGELQNASALLVEYCAALEGRYEKLDHRFENPANVL